ncbi:protein-disulfide isomerase [Mangrovactinospora gilvigrisea]|uniref:Protein-disulfide isomerase n=1 Tax=Mangrovactinospora gilvigrisea TaxID=1428644 RepID=A0A1J7C6R5_9ACTN|nr:DsbA family oxidoreductase [Mangrovactinospora gilvigrisea]OIV35338.1 protein-disulfide isomerase [Mangrovactinospora gilvigrisea]
MRVEIWSDINCPFCYLGKARFEAALARFPHRDAVEVVHRSFELDPSLGEDDHGQVVPIIARKYGISEAQAAANERGIGAQAAEMGLPYVTEGRDYGSSFGMHRLLHFARGKGREEQLLDLLYRANFGEEAPLFGDTERVVALAVEAGLDASDARAVLADPERFGDAVRAEEREAAELGATGVPFFVLDRKYGVSGAQPPEAFTQALTQAWGDRPAPLTALGDPDAAESEAVCGPDGCAVPGAVKDAGA